MQTQIQAINTTAELYAHADGAAPKLVATGNTILVPVE